MGRTIPSFRIASTMEEREWKSFRNSLDKSDRKIFDQMLSIGHLYNSASSYACKPIRIHPIFMSIIFHHYKQLVKLSKKMNNEYNELSTSNDGPAIKNKIPVLSNVVGDANRRRL